jgi:hypothetical protein
MLRLALLLVLAGLLGATAAAASTPAQYRAAINATCRSYTPLLHKEERDLKNVAGVERLAQLAVSEDQKLLAHPVPAQLAHAMRPVLAQLRVFHAQALAALRETKRGHEAAAFGYLRRMQSEQPALDKLFNAVGLRACGSER